MSVGFCRSLIELVRVSVLAPSGWLQIGTLINVVRGVLMEEMHLSGSGWDKEVKLLMLFRIFLPHRVQAGLT